MCAAILPCEIRIGIITAKDALIQMLYVPKEEKRANETHTNMFIYRSPSVAENTQPWKISYRLSTMSPCTCICVYVCMCIHVLGILGGSCKYRIKKKDEKAVFFVLSYINIYIYFQCGTHQVFAWMLYILHPSKNL